MVSTKFTEFKYHEKTNYMVLAFLGGFHSIEVMHKAWHDASAVKVGHFEWLTMYTGVTGQKRAKPVSLKQATIP